TPTWDPHVRGWGTRFALRHMLSVPMLRPAFVNYDISAIGAFAPQWLRRRGMPLLTWTVRTPAQRADAERLADAMVFEGFVP
ncbi:MAG: glycerophosphodiester phosphodiesterase, partial [Pseudomonadota bacterium]